MTGFAKTVLLAGAGAAAFGLPASVAFAQGPEAAPAQLEEVIVTAQRREENLQTVPVSVVAFSAEQLARRQITQVTDLRGAAPNVMVGQGLGDPTDLAIGMRGLTQAGAQSVTDPTIGLYVDGVYRARTSGSNAGFIDMERVEVLRGPQGTLFGRNTIGGALNITTKAPVNDFEGQITAELGNYDQRRVLGVLNVPINDKLAARFVYQHDEHEGYVKDLFTGTRQNDKKEDYGRISVKYTPNDDWTVLLFGDATKFTGHSQAFKAFFLNPAQPQNATQAALQPGIPAGPGNTGGPRLVSDWVNQGGFYTTYAENNPKISVQAVDFTGTIEGKVGSVNVKSITAYRNEQADRPTDFDGTPYRYFENPIKPFKYHQISQELQGYGKAFSDRLDYITGLFYFEEEDRMGQDTELFAPSATSFGSWSDTFAKNKSVGAFAQASFAVTSQIKVTGGVRYALDIRRAIYFDKRVNTLNGAVTCGLQLGNGPVPPYATGIFNAPYNEAVCRLNTVKLKQHYWPFTVGLDYTPTDDALIYAKYSRGFRSGGFLQAGASIANPVSAPLLLAGFGPEQLDTIEGGAKLQFLDRRLRLNGAVYRSIYKDVQLTNNSAICLVAPCPPNPLSSVAITENSGQAKIWGVEFEGEALLGRLQLSAALGYTHPEWTKVASSLNPYTVAPPNNGTFLGLDTPWRDFPKWTYALAAAYPIEMEYGRLTLSATWSYQSKVQFAPAPISSPATAADYAVRSAALAQKGYGLLNGKITFDLKERPISISIWGRNLTDEKYKVRAADFTAFGLVGGPIGDPPTYGATVTYRLGG